MDRNNKVRLIDLNSSIIKANNKTGKLDVVVSHNGTMSANMIFKHWAHLSIELFSEDSLINVKDTKISFQIRVASGSTELWSAFVSEDFDWHPPVLVTTLHQFWQTVDLSLNDYSEVAKSFRFLKLIVRNDCQIELRDLGICGHNGIDSLKLIIPWYGRDSARIRARDTAIRNLSKQNVPFQLTVMELLCDGEPATFVPRQQNHSHVCIQKDSRYLGIFHKEAIFNYYIRTTPISPYSAYVFLDSDVFSENTAWFSSIIDRLSQSLEECEDLLLQPFSRVIDTVSKKTHYSICRAERAGMKSLSINSGLCWATTGKTLIECDIHFPHTLVTGIADAVFASNYVKQSDRIPYLPPFSISKLMSSNQCSWDHINEDLIHVNHGEVPPGSYAMRDLLWQAVLDHNCIKNLPTVLEDNDGFCYFSQQNCSSQLALAHMMNLETPDSVLALILRNFGAPMNQIQHISKTPCVNITEDSRSLDVYARLQWECARSNFRLYTLGVEKCTIPENRNHNNGSFFDHGPLLREIINEKANHPIILVTADGCVTYPSMLVEINQALHSDDIVFFCATPQNYYGHKQSAISVATQPDATVTSETEKTIAAVAFTRAWWVENQMAIPHGLVAAENFLECFYNLVSIAHPQVKNVSNHCRIITADRGNKSIIQHNTRITESISTLHRQGFLSIGPIDRSRRKLKIKRPVTKDIYHNTASVINSIETLESTNGIMFDPFVNASFYNGNKNAAAYEEKWCGVVHGNFEYAKHLPSTELDLNQLFKNEFFQESLGNCAGLFTHTKYLRQRLIDNDCWTSSIPIDVIPFTTTEPTRGFRADWFWRDSDSRLYCVGSGINRLRSFFQLNERNFSKILLTPASPSEDFRIYLNAEMLESNSKDSVSVQSLSSMSSYDDILSRNPVFLDYYDLNTNPVLHECIVRNTPVILRRHPAAEELLGADYPLFYSDLEQASNMLNEKSILEGHVYLANIQKQQFYHSSLPLALENSMIYQCL